MARNTGILAVCLMLGSQLSTAAQREIVETDWAGFRQQLDARGLAGRKAQIRFSGGGDTTAKVIGVGERTLTVRANRATERWKTAHGVAEIPSDQVSSVRFSGRTGRGRAIGSVVGAGGGGSAAAIVLAAGSDVTEGPFAILIPASAAVAVFVGLLVGYFIGRAMDKPAPEFVLNASANG